MSLNKIRRADRSISWQWQVLIWYGGLRGAMAFALAYDYNEASGTPQSAAIFTTTMVIVVFTIIVMGGFMYPVLNRLKIETGVVSGGRRDKLDMDELQHPSKVTGIDRRWIKPFFTKRVYKAPELNSLGGHELEVLEDAKDSSNDVNKNHEGNGNEVAVALDPDEVHKAGHDVLEGFEPMKMKK
jgi:hypothetical protein